jgi:FkbM family methyltransferase
MNPYRPLFWSAVHIGRPFGGVRPHRITYWLWRRAFTAADFSESDYGWWRDRWGSELWLNPRYHLDFTIIAFRYYDKALHRYIDRMVGPGMTCFDIGANIGAVSTHLARTVGAAGHVHAFEPVPALRVRLQKNLARNDCDRIVSVHPLALSNATGEARLAVAAVDADNQGLASLVAAGTDRLTGMLTVQTVTLDDFVAERRIDRIDFMKIDIQGAEILLLEGGRRTLAELRPDLIVEVSPADMAGIGKTSRDLLRALEGCGYQIHELRSDGTPGPRIDVSAVPPDFDRENIFCTMKARGVRPGRPTS